ncbi:MAG: ABC transporter substrate-binding protein [Spirochaetales bacterium]
MRNLIRVLTATLVVLALAGPMAFANGQQEEAAEATNPTDNPWTDGEDLSGTEVQIFGAYVDEDASRFRDALEPFIEETGINVEYEGSGDFESLITVRAEGGDAPDIAAFPQPGLMEDLHSQGYLYDMEEWFGMDFLEEQYDQDWIDMSTVDGDVAGTWYRTSVKSLVWYTPSVFEEEGYEIPETWDELMDLSDQMIDDGYTPWSVAMESAGATGWVATDWIEDIMLRIHEPEVYDEWVTNDVKFDSPEVREAFEILDDVWFEEDYVLGGIDSILTVPFGDGANPLLRDEPAALMHRQASFIQGFLPDGTEVGPDGDIDFFYLPPIEEEQGEPVLVAGDIMSPMDDRPEIRAVMRFLSTAEGTRGWLEQGGFVSPHNDVDFDWYPEVDRRYAEILDNADTVRFDASDLMPGAVGTGTFWEGVVDWTNSEGDDLDSVLPAIDEGFED